MAKLQTIFKLNKIILAIDTSFNDTTCAILKGNKVLSNIIYTSNKYNVFKGVIPNIAYNLHITNIYDIVQRSLYKSKINIKKIDAISFTKGPGLIGSLMIGENFAKSLSLSLNIPLIGVNHIHGHLFSIYLNKNQKFPNFPYLCLSISGGHTKLILINNIFTIKELGCTLDENLGILFDKFSILLGFKYLEGPKKIEIYSKFGRFKYKIPIPNVKGLNFSFSGLLTYLKNKIKNKKINKKDLCRSFLETIFIILNNKINKAIKQTGINKVVITGGVSSNNFLIYKFKKISKLNKWKYYRNNNKIYLKDNAAMIALIGQIKYFYKLYENYNTISNSKLSLDIF
ncbi:MAG: tRNA (adenosine(37)-N6)-threonylcarbamoyltransferase complex transferase subunit TsaD [Candidatus Shikimatogenerans sp. JK-2022]|nr:tRNA (adenosine(37)-N6)-threonylcarbamoyltransferase complex transferase subunit TsaD [Candidatus Shikimatogenerans bostrichidophilus]